MASYTYLNEYAPMTRVDDTAPSNLDKVKKNYVACVLAFCSPSIYKSLNIKALHTIMKVCYHNVAKLKLHENAFVVSVRFHNAVY